MAFSHGNDDCRPSIWDRILSAVFAFVHMSCKVFTKVF